MAVSFVASAAEFGDAFIAISGHAVGDLLVALGFQVGSFGTVPVTPSGWTSLQTTSTPVSSNLVSKIATSTSETMTWTDGTNTLAVSAYRGAVVGAVAANSTTSNTVTFPALTLQKTNGTSWVARFAGHNDGIPGTLSGYTLRAKETDSGNGLAGAWDSNGTVSSNPTSGTATAGAVDAYAAYTLEIKSPTSPSAFFAML